MKQVMIDGCIIPDRQSLHQVLARCLALPDWYGNNLDALADCLSEIAEDTAIGITNFDILEETLGSYALSFRRVLLRAAEENPHIRLHLM